MSKILYQDDQVTIYKQLIIIRKYYFPLASSKTIMISDISSITIQNLQGVNHRWGINSKFLNNWFPYDANRKNKTKFIEFILKGKKIRSTITPDDPDKAFRVLWQNFTNEGIQYNQKGSQKPIEQLSQNEKKEIVSQDQETAHKIAPQVQQIKIQVEEID